MSSESRSMHGSFRVFVSFIGKSLYATARVCLHKLKDSELSSKK